MFAKQLLGFYQGYARILLQFTFLCGHYRSMRIKYTAPVKKLSFYCLSLIINSCKTRHLSIPLAWNWATPGCSPWLSYDVST